MPDRAKNLNISFAEHVTHPELRGSLERSITTRIAHNAREVDELRAVHAVRTELLAVINAPLRRLIAQDSAAARALEELRMHHSGDLQSAISAREKMLTPDVSDISAPRDRPGAQPLVLAGAPPYEVSWTWFHEEGDEPSLLHLDDQTGEIKIRGATGDAGFVAANAGFGLVITPDRNLTQWFTQLRYSGIYSLFIPVLGDLAISRAGMKYEVMENETDSISASFGEIYNLSLSASGPFSTLSDSVPERFGFVNIPTQMLPGHTYTLIVDINVYAEASPSGGTANSLADCTAAVTSIGHA
jgi:hypothetical protein